MGGDGLGIPSAPIQEEVLDVNRVVDLSSAAGSFVHVSEVLYSE